MLNNFPETFAFVQIHHGDDYWTTWGNARFTFYGAGGYPTSYFDGTIERAGAWPYSTYYSDYLNRRGVSTRITIDVGGEHDSGNTYKVSAKVCVEPGGSTTSMRIYMVQVLDYWPPTPTYHRNGFKQAVATQDLTLSPGYCQEIHRYFTFDSTSMANQQDIKIIVWAQEPQSSSPPSNRAEVFQAATMTWPFPLLYTPGDYDDDGDIDLADLGYFNGCMSGPDPGSPPSSDCLNVFDFDLDVDIDLADFGGFQSVFTGSCPWIVAHPEPQAPCEGYPATFTVVADGTPPLSYQWRKNGVDIPGATSDSYTIDPAGPGDVGSYAVVVTNACGSVTSNSATLTLAVAPQQSGTLGDLSKCEGEPATFIANFTGTPPLTYQWEKDTVPIPGEESNVLTIDPVTPADAGGYRCKATNSCGWFAYTNTATLTVQPAPTITDQPDDTCVEVGQTAVFTVAATGSGSLWYQWLKDGFDIPGEGGWDYTTLTLTNVQPADAGQYGVYVLSSESPTCLVYSDEATLQVGGCTN